MKSDDFWWYLSINFDHFWWFFDEKIATQSNLMISGDFSIKSDDLYDISMKFDDFWLFSNQIWLFLIVFRWNLMILMIFRINYKECTYETDDQPYQTSEAANLLAWQPSNQLQ